MSFKYGKTKQFKDVIRDIAHAHRFKGMDEVTGDPIYSSDPLPKLVFKGTVKLHGTNAGIMQHPDGSYEYLSRNNKVQVGYHFGFPEAMEQRKNILDHMFADVCEQNDVPDDHTVFIYGEWCGPNIQKGVAISELEKKTFFVFAAKSTSPEGESRWLKGLDFINIPSGIIRNHDGVIRNIYDFDNWAIQIDLDNPALSQNKLVEITEKIEERCPVANKYNIQGVGEGAVWETWYNGERFIFKVKGKKHSTSKVKTLASVDPIKAKSKADFIEYAVTLNRVKQGVQEVASSKEISEDAVNRSHTGDVLRWVANDILAEELDALQNSALEWKDVAKEATTKARLIFFNIIDGF